LLEEDEEFILNSDLLNPTHIANVVPKEARTEMNLIKDEMYNGSIARTLTAALARGGPRTTSSGLFDFEQLEIEPLQSALVSAHSRTFAPCVEVSVAVSGAVSGAVGGAVSGAVSGAVCMLKTVYAASTASSVSMPLFAQCLLEY
jgi:hypothetical protein